MTLLLILISLISPALAEETPTLSDSWGSIYDGYDSAQFGKIPTEKEYKDSIQALQNLKNKGKSKKSKKKEDKKEPVAIFEMPSSLSPLFRLMTDAYYNGQIIPRGFYLVKSVNKGNKHFIRFTQGKNIIVADIEAEAFRSKSKENKVFSEFLEDNILKITYTDYDYILEAYLCIQ